MKTIQEMVREVEAYIAATDDFVGWSFAAGQLEAFAKLVREDEREAIYDLVMEAPFRQNLETEHNGEDLLFAVKVMAFDITSAIRARSNP